MSVCLFDASEFAALMHTYRVLRPTLGYSAPDEPEMSVALFYAYLANVAAYQATYHEWIDAARTAEAQQTIGTALTEPIAVDGARDDLARTFIREARLLHYNCISNGGGDFLPERARDVLERAMRAMLDELADVYRESTAGQRAAA